MIHWCLTVLVTVLVASPAYAGVYKCVEDGTGKITFSDVPCPSNAAGGRIVVKPTNQFDGSGYRREADRERQQDALAAQRAEQDRFEGSGTNYRQPIPQAQPLVAVPVKPGPTSWETCRQMGMTSPVDCKRYDTDPLFRAKINRANGIETYTPTPAAAPAPPAMDMQTTRKCTDSRDFNCIKKW